MNLKKVIRPTLNWIIESFAFWGPASTMSRFAFFFHWNQCKFPSVTLLQISSDNEKELDVVDKLESGKNNIAQVSTNTGIFYISFSV